jgi:hypothetical protein
VTDFTRRKMLGVAATAAAGAVTSTNLAPAEAAAPPDAAPPDPAELQLFVTLSVALTGIVEAKLAPAVDPINIKLQYFDVVRRDPRYPALLAIVRKDPANGAANVMNDPKAKFLGRSIILAWYLGAWYDPDKLEIYTRPGDHIFPLTPQMVISPAAYTQAWTWRVAQAHPMGYSEFRYGYWAKEPIALEDYIGKAT